MTITREKKKEIISDLGKRFSKAKTIIFLGFQGLTVKENMELRKKLGSENIDYKVAKKTLIKKGLEDAKIEGAGKFDLEGPVATAIGYEDEVAPARLANEYSKINNKLKLLGGFVCAKYMDASSVKDLALLPNKDSLRAQLVGTINAPLSGFVNVLSGNMRGLVNVIKAISEKKENK